jgi:hypothetical protein
VSQLGPASDALTNMGTVPSPLRRWAIACGLCLVLLLGVSVRVRDLATVEHRSPDEATYTLRAARLLRGGPGSIRADARTYLSEELQWSTPVPTRVGYIGLLALAMKVSGAEDVHAGSYLACFASVLSLGVALFVGIRQIGIEATLLGLFFLAAFPPELAIARRCWQDAIVGLAGILLLGWTAAILRARSRIVLLIGFALCGSACLLVKETLLFLYVPCFAVVLWNLARRGDNRREAGILVAAGGLGAAICYALLALCTGGWNMPVALVRVASSAAGSSSYALATSTGPGYLLLVAMHRIAPMTVNLAAFGFAMAVAGPAARRTPALLSAGFLSVFMVVPHWLNLRFVSPVFAPLCLLAGHGLWNIFLAARKRLPRPILIVAGLAAGTILLVSLAGDLDRFQKVFVRDGANDLAVKVIARGE